ncbi:MAG: hypothetical protein ACI9T7_000485 [Oleiphilaceae bacterium]|jgi:hypothetical protein
MELTMTIYFSRVANLTSAFVKLSILSSFVLSLMACQTPPLEVHSNTNPLSAFNQYKTYKIVALNGSEINVIPIINKAIANELNAKGYTQINVNTADLIIKYKIKIRHGEQLRIEAIPVKSNVYSRTTTESVDEASMLVNALDSKTSEVVWKASTVRDLHTINENTPIQERVKVSMSEVFAEFPTTSK